jgi:hypothetical protein
MLPIMVIVRGLRLSRYVILVAVIGFCLLAVETIEVALRLFVIFFLCTNVDFKFVHNVVGFTLVEPTKRGPLHSSYQD